LKVLILTGNYPNKNALNNGIFIHQQVKALQQLGVECMVLLLHNWYPPLGLHKYHTYWRDGYNLHKTFFEEYEGVKIYPVPMFVKMPGRLFIENYYERAARSIIKKVKNSPALRNADWLYAHFLTDNGYIAARIKDELKLKLAAIARGDDIHAWPEANAALRPNLAYVFEKADLLLANSRNLGIDARKWMMPGNIREVETVYNGIDSVTFRPPESAQEKAGIKAKYKLTERLKYMICVATPVALKGWNELLMAVKEAGSKFDGWQLLMVAPKRVNNDALNLQQEADKLGITERVRFIGALAPADLAELLRACDAFILPSYDEGMANSLLEAMATGLTCIATEVGGHNEVIEHEVNGLLILPRSVKSIVVSIEQVTGNEELRTCMGQEARARMIAFGDYQLNAGKLLALFNSQRC